MPTSISSETVRQSTRVPIRIPLTVTSLNPSVEFSESCHTVSVNAEGCAIHCEKSIPIATPVVLRLNSGKEIGGKVVFCKGSASNDKLFGLGILLHERGNVWELNSCPKDWLESGTAEAASGDVNSAAKSPSNPGITRSEVESIRIELQRQMRDEMAASLADAQTRFSQELLAQNDQTSGIKKLLQEAARVKDLIEGSMQSLQTHEEKVSDETRKAIEQIELRINAHNLKLQSDSQQLCEELRSKTDEVDASIKKAADSGLEKAQKQISELVEKNRQGINDLIEKVSDQIHSDVQQRLEKDFEAKQEEITSSHNAIATEVARFHQDMASNGDRIAELNELYAQRQTDFKTGLDQSVSETVEQSRSTMEQLFDELRTGQVGQARGEIEAMLGPITSRLSAQIEEGNETVRQLTREHDEIKNQMGAVTERKEEMQLWLAQQSLDLEKTVGKVLSDGREQAKTLVQTALESIRNPVEKLSIEGKRKIDEFAMSQHSDLSEGIRRLQGLLATLEQQAEESLHASSQATRATPPPPAVENQERPVAHPRGETEKANGRGQTTFAQKLSGLVRGKES